jgi:ABC-type nickel/cobalt efflux system permease component RcnA
MEGSAFSRRPAMTARQVSQGSVTVFMLSLGIAIVTSFSALAPLHVRWFILDSLGKHLL